MIIMDKAMACLFKIPIIQYNLEPRKMQESMFCFSSNTANMLEKIYIFVKEGNRGKFSFLAIYCKQPF